MIRANRMNFHSVKKKRCGHKPKLPRRNVSCKQAVSRISQIFSQLFVQCLKYTSNNLLIKVTHMIILGLRCKVKEKSAYIYKSHLAHHAGAYHGFRSMKQIGVFLLPPGWDASPSQGYPNIKVAGK